MYRLYGAGIDLPAIHDPGVVPVLLDSSAHREGKWLRPQALVITGDITERDVQKEEKSQHEITAFGSEAAQARRESSRRDPTVCKGISQSLTSSK